MINGDICLHKEKLLDGTEIKSHIVHINECFILFSYTKVNEYNIVCVKKNWKIDFSIEICF